MKPEGDMGIEVPPELTGEPGAAKPPAADGPEKPKKQFEINIYRDWCKSCGICAALCPKQVLARDDEGGPVVADPEACIGCGWCELHCPDFAISVRPRPEPAVAAGAAG